MSIIIPTTNHYTKFNDEIDITLRLDAKYLLPKCVFLDKLFKNCEHLKTYTTFCDRGIQPHFARKTGFFVVKSKDVDWAFTTEDELSQISKQNYNTNSQIQLKENDVLVNGTGDGTACRPSIWLSSQIKAITDGHVTVIRTSKELSPKFLFVFLRTKFGYMQLERQVIGSTGQLEIYPGHITQIKVPIFDDVKQVEKLVSESYSCYYSANSEFLDAKKLFQDEIKISEITNTKYKIKWNSDVDMLDSLDAGFHTNNLLNNDVFTEGHEPLSSFADPLKGNSPPYSGYGTRDHRILKTKNLTGKGIDWSEIKNGFVPDSFYQNNLSAKVSLDDIITSCDAHQDYFIGKEIDIVDFIPSDYEQQGVISEQHTIIIRKKENTNPYILLLFLQSELGYNLIQQKIRGIGQLTPTDLGKITIPKKLTKIKNANKIESLIKSSYQHRRKSKEKLEQATRMVEKLIEDRFGQK